MTGIISIAEPALHQVALKATDLARATEFWQQLLGTKPIATFDPPGLAFFWLGQTRLLLDVNAPSGLIYLRVPSVVEAVEALKAKGIEIATEPHMIFDDAEGTFGAAGEHESMAFFRDSEGNAVGLASRAIPSETLP